MPIKFLRLRCVFWTPNLFWDRYFKSNFNWIKVPFSTGLCTVKTMCFPKAFFLFVLYPDAFTLMGLLIWWYSAVILLRTLMYPSWIFKSFDSFNIMMPLWVNAILSSEEVDIHYQSNVNKKVFNWNPALDSDTWISPWDCSCYLPSFMICSKKCILNTIL